MTKRMIISLLALVGIFVALYLTLYKLGKIGHLACTVGGCESVNTSSWATFMGAPVAVWGLGYYVATFIVSFLGTTAKYANRREMSIILAASSLIGVLFSAWLTYLELFVIHAICQYCVISAIIVTIIFLLSVADLRDLGKATR